MRALVSGMGGTVAPALAEILRAEGATVMRWDRATMPYDSKWRVKEVLDKARPDWICHLATGPIEWAEWIAIECAERGINLLWTGTVSVFGPASKPPLTIHMPPTATDEYGKYKAECERRVLAANPRAIAPRLGWQVAPTHGSNTMTDFFHRAAIGNSGELTVSTNWIPSCCFVDDSARAIREIMARGEPGIHHIEGNNDRLSMFDLATGLARLGKRDWRIEPTDEPVRENRMIDERLAVRQVKDRLNS